METNKVVYSVQEFCDAHQVGRNLFYKLVAAGTGPRIMKLGRRTLITREAAATWRQEMERQSLNTDAQGTDELAGAGRCS